eukprot:COSAG06_NODE_3204_length_5688_cov_11.682233_2_plen_63_part_00
MTTAPAAIQGETNIEDPGCFATLKMDGGLVATVCAGETKTTSPSPLSAAMCTDSDPYGLHLS